MLAKLKEEYGDKVVFLSLTIEPQDTPEKIAEVMKTPSLTYARASETTWEKLMTMGGEQWGPVPANVFIAANGDVTLAIVGTSGLEEAIETLLE